MADTADDGIHSLSADRPIDRPEDDLLGRLPLVKLLADEIRSAPTEDGFVMALTAAWGEGKTSVLNLVADEVGDQMVIVRFNPWLFSDAHSLVVRFFSELGVQVKGEQRLRKIGKRLVSYGQAVAPVGSLIAGPAAGLATQTLTNLTTAAPRGVEDERADLKQELHEKQIRILVLVDDIDRLQKPEILDLMRLVKLVGDLPYVTYLLAFDRPYVEDALDKNQFDGRSYLEKIVQVTFDLPPIRDSELQSVLLDNLNAALEGLEYLPHRQERWSEVLEYGLGPMFSNVRDIARYVSGVPARVRMVGQEVALEDILALEALRVFEPGVHQELPFLVQALTKERPGMFIDEKAEEEREKAQLERALDKATPARREKVKKLLATLFPRAAENLGGPGYRSDGWKINRQVADASALRAYLHANIDPGAASYALVTEVVASLGDKKRLERLLGEADVQVLLDLLQRFPGFADRIDPEGALVGASELLRLESRLPTEREVLRPAPKFYIKIAIHSILEVLPDRAAKEDAVEQLFADASTSSERISLIEWFGTFSERETKRPDLEILTEERTERLEAELGQLVRSQSSAQLASEDQLVWLTQVAYGKDDEGRALLAKTADDALIAALVNTLTNPSMETDEPVFNLKLAERLFDSAFLAQRLAEIDEQALSGSERAAIAVANTALHAIDAENQNRDD